MTISDGAHKSTDMRELGHFTHTQWNLEPYFLTKNGSSFQIYFLTKNGSSFQIYRVSFAQSKCSPNEKA